MANVLIKKLQETGKNAWKAVKNTGETILEYRRPIMRGVGLTLLYGVLTFMPAKADAETYYIAPGGYINATIYDKCQANPPTLENPHIFNLWDETTGETGEYNDLSAQNDSGWLVIYNQPNCKINGIINLTPDYKLDTTKPNTIVLQTIKCLGNNTVSNLARKVTEDHAMGICFDGDNITLQNVHIFSQDGVVGPRGFFSLGTRSNNLITGCSTYGLRYGVNTEEQANTIINTSVFQDCYYGFATAGYIRMGSIDGDGSPDNIGQNVFIGCTGYLGWVDARFLPPVIPAELNYWYDINGILITNVDDIYSNLFIWTSSKPFSKLENIEDIIDVIPYQTTPHPAFPGPTEVEDNVWSVCE